jgi:hypothetical protein
VSGELQFVGPMTYCQERLGLPVDEVPGGHLVRLIRPVQLADRLAVYLAEVWSQAIPLSRSIRP